MTTAATSLLGLALPVTGELSGTWGDTVNNSITSLLDTAVAGTTTLSTDGDVTLSTTTLAANQARQAIILWTANGTTTRNITAPAQSKIYTVINASAGTQSIVLRGAGPTTGVTIIKGESAVCAWNGSDFIKISNTGGSASFTNVTVSGTTTLSGLTASTALALDASKNVVSVTNTGTGNNVLSASPTLTGTVAGASLSLSSLTSGRVAYAGTSGLLQDSANLTFDGTTLTAGGLATGGSVTLSGGTANGVLYLNGSKVATSGSALTFDGTNLGIGNTSGADVTLLTLTSNSGIRQQFNPTNALATKYNWRIDVNGLVDQTWSLVPSTAVGGSTFSTPVYQANGNGTQIWSVGSSEAMRLTSTGLGIGTSSPSDKLEVVGSGSAGIRVSRSGVSTQYATLSSGSTGPTLNASSAVGALTLGVNGSTYATLDSSGNLGIGTSSPAKKLDVVGQIGTQGSIAAFGIGSRTGSGAEFSLYNPTGVDLRFYGNSADLMTLTTSGNLGLGVTPSAWDSTYKVLEVGYGGDAFLGNTGSNQIGVVNNGYWNGGWKYKNSTYANLYLQQTGQHQWWNAASGTAGNAISFTQAMTLDASGNLLVGATSTYNSNKFYVNTNSAANAAFFSNNVDATFQLSLSSGVTKLDAPTGILTLATSGTERARIDSSGNLLVGTTSVTDHPSTGVQLANASGVIGGVYIGHASGVATGNYYETYSYNSTIIGSITQSGTTAVLFNVTSDQRLKENIVDAPEFGSVIDSIKVRSYDWKSDQTHQRAGFVAQELVTVAPEAVHQPADPEEMMAVDYSKLVPMLVKEIQSLRKRLADAGIA